MLEPMLAQLLQDQGGYSLSAMHSLVFSLCQGGHSTEVRALLHNTLIRFVQACSPSQEQYAMAARRVAAGCWYLDRIIPFDGCSAMTVEDLLSSAWTIAHDGNSSGGHANKRRRSIDPESLSQQPPPKRLSISQNEPPTSNN
jgi:hypothetical protein